MAFDRGAEQTPRRSSLAQSFAAHHSGRSSLNLHFYRSSSGIRNFGDELNPWLWPQLLGDVVNGDGRTVLVGIGTILDDSIPQQPVKIVFGSGTGYRGELKLDEKFSIYCVRGPLTAKRLCLDMRVAITDAAHLVSKVWSPSAERSVACAYMPHWCMHSNLLAELCESAGVKYIDPTEPDVELTMKRITESERLITEAMHGAIIADEFDVPWIPVSTTSDILQFKWQDWCQSVSLDYRPMTMLPIWDKPKRGFGHQALKQNFKKSIFVYQLKRLARHGRPILSRKEKRIENFQRLEEKLGKLRDDFERGAYE